MAWKWFVAMQIDSVFNSWRKIKLKEKYLALIFDDYFLKLRITDVLISSKQVNGRDIEHRILDTTKKRSRSKNNQTCRETSCINMETCIWRLTKITGFLDIGNWRECDTCLLPHARTHWSVFKTLSTKNKSRGKRIPFHTNMFLIAFLFAKGASLNG